MGSINSNLEQYACQGQMSRVARATVAEATGVPGNGHATRVTAVTRDGYFARVTVHITSYEVNSRKSAAAIWMKPLTLLLPWQHEPPGLGRHAALDYYCWGRFSLSFFFKKKQ
jgi:hypothetical protein